MRENQFEFFGCLRHASRFTVVGLCAMTVHFLLVVGLVYLTVAPLLANVAAFLIAFQVSFWGHLGWSFSDLCATRNMAMRRFFLVAVGGFALNEVLYAALLRWTPLPYQVALFLVLGTVALGTFVISRCWAFNA